MLDLTFRRTVYLRCREVANGIFEVFHTATRCTHAYLISRGCATVVAAAYDQLETITSPIDHWLNGVMGTPTGSCTINLTF